MPRHPPIALKTLDHSHCRCPSGASPERYRHKKTSFSRSVREARLGDLIICRGLSVPGDKPLNQRSPNKSSLHDVKQNRRSASARRKPLIANDCPSSRHPPQKESGGAGRDRTDDILLAKQALSQLSYGPLRHSRQRLQRMRQHSQGRPAVAACAAPSRSASSQRLRCGA